MSDDPLLQPYADVDTTLKLESILLKEFDYAHDMLSKASADRDSMSTVYFRFGSVIVPAFGILYQFGVGIRAYLLPIAAALLLGFGIFNLSLFFKLIRIRHALRECQIAMNIIKEYYIARVRLASPDIERAFRWRMATIPRGEHFGSSNFMLALGLALFGSLCFSGATFLGILLLPTNGGSTHFIQSGSPLHYGVALVVLLVSLFLHMRYFRVRTWRA